MANELEKHVATWLLRLKGLTREGKDRVTGKALGDLARMLAVDFPIQAFTAESMQAVAGDAPDGWFPSAYAVMKALLTDWWRIHRPPSADASWPPGVDLLAEYQDRQWFRHYHLGRPRALEADAARVARLGEFTQGPYPDRYDPQTDICYSRVGRLCSLIRRYSPAAWALIRNPPGSETAPPDDDGPLDGPPVDRVIGATTAALRPRGLFEGPETPAVAEQMRSFRDIPPLAPRPSRGALTADQLAAARATVRGGAAP